MNANIALALKRQNLPDDVMENFDIMDKLGLITLHLKKGQVEAKLTKKGKKFMKSDKKDLMSFIK